MSPLTRLDLVASESVGEGGGLSLEAPVGPPAVARSARPLVRRPPLAWPGVEPDGVAQSAGHPPARMAAVLSPSTPDDQSRTWDGRVLDTKEKLLEFLAEVEDARAAGRSLDPDDNQS